LNELKCREESLWTGVGAEDSLKARVKMRANEVIGVIRRRKSRLGWGKIREFILGIFLRMQFFAEYYHDLFIKHQ
jgi:hypothetical protein